MTDAEPNATEQRREYRRTMALYVLRHFGLDDGQAPTPGSFYATLLNALGKADAHNRARLGRGFPVLVALFEAAQNGGEDGIEHVRKVAADGYWIPRTRH